MPPAPKRQPTSGNDADDLEFMKSRGGHDRGTGRLNPEMAARMAAAGRAYEAATGERANYGEMSRDFATQARYYANYRRGIGGLAAPPGRSRHEDRGEGGEATDVPYGGFRDWLASGGASRYGLEFLRGRAYARDRVHVQMTRDWRGALPPRPTREAKGFPAVPYLAEHMKLDAMRPRTEDEPNNGNAFDRQGARQRNTVDIDINADAKADGGDRGGSKVPRIPSTLQTNAPQQMPLTPNTGEAVAP
jgi:hypothetical protein